MVNPDGHQRFIVGFAPIDPICKEKVILGCTSGNNGFWGAFRQKSQWEALFYLYMWDAPGIVGSRNRKIP